MSNLADLREAAQEGNTERPADVTTRLDELARHRFTPERYTRFFLDYIKPTAYRYRVWMLTDPGWRDAAKTLDFDDLMQIGALAILRTIDRMIDRDPDDIDPYIFSTYLKNEIRGRFRDAMTQAAGKATVSLPDDPDAADDERLRHARVPGPGDLLLRDAALVLDDAPTAPLIAAGMFLVEEMRQQDVAEILGVGQATVSRWIKDIGICAVERAHNLTSSHAWDELTPWPQATTQAPLDRAGEWCEDRYGVSLVAWLQWVRLAFATDPGYLVDLYGIAWGRMVHRHADTHDHEDDVSQLTLMDPPPASVKDVIQRLRWGDRRASAALRTWRHRRDVESRDLDERIAEALRAT